MIYLAIVGTSHLTENEEMDARKRIVWIMREYLEKSLTCSSSFSLVPALKIITGDARGIDTLVKQIAEEQNIPCKKFEADSHDWNSYRKRNIQIAKNCSYIISITTPIKTEACYHCREPHQRTGGCWTRKWAKDRLGIEGETIVL